MRFLFPLIFAVFFIGWLIYRVFIKKDLRQHINDMYFGIFFLAVWALLYWLIMG